MKENVFSQVHEDIVTKKDSDCADIPERKHWYVNPEWD